MMRINEENWISLTLDYLRLLSKVYEDDVMPSMIDERTEKIELVR